MQPSPQQAAIYDWVTNGKGSALVEAVAGAGKTTTLVEAVRLMKGSVQFTAYNKKIADEIGTRIAGTSARASTFHSAGFSSWRKVAPKVKVDQYKMRDIADQLRVPQLMRGFVADAVSLAKQRAVGVLTPSNDPVEWQYLVDHFDLDEKLAKESGLSLYQVEGMIADGIQWAQAALKRSIECDDQVIDFDDMIYAPLVHDSKVYGNDWVLVDEAQDTNPSRRALAKKMLRPGGRLIAVGDSRQAIYGFTGADNDSMEIIAREFACTRLPLTITYRCPKAVVALAQQFVSHIQAAPTAPEGAVRAIKAPELAGYTAAELRPQDAILCRNTAPLVALAYDLIRRRIGCHVEGKDIGRGLVALASKWKVPHLGALRDKLENYARVETEKFLAKGQEQKADALNDRVGTLYILIDQLGDDATLADLKAACDRLFGDTEPGKKAVTLTLSTVHKSKGREWERVYLLGRNKYMPSKFARQDWQLDQEINLIYVAVTRAKSELIEVEVAA